MDGMGMALRRRAAGMCEAWKGVRHPGAQRPCPLLGDALIGRRRVHPMSQPVEDRKGA